MKSLDEAVGAAYFESITADDYGAEYSRCREPREERISHQQEPRNPHTVECHQGRFPAAIAGTASKAFALLYAKFNVKGTP